MLWERAFAGSSRTESSAVDETAITLKLDPVPQRSRWLARWPMTAAVTLAALTAATMLVVDGSEDAPARRAAAPRPRAIAMSPGDGEVILASTARPTFGSGDDVAITQEVDEIVIFDEPVAPPPETTTRATRRARARSTARLHTSAGEAARRVGDLAAAKHEFEAALAALPSYGPAAAGLAEILMAQGSYRSALVYAKRASRAAPRKLDYMLLLGDAYSRTSNRAAAERLWRKASAYGSAEAKSRLAG